MLNIFKKNLEFHLTTCIYFATKQTWIEVKQVDESLVQQFLDDKIDSSVEACNSLSELEILKEQVGQIYDQLLFDSDLALKEKPNDFQIQSYRNHLGIQYDWAIKSINFLNFWKRRKKVSKMNQQALILATNFGS